MTVQERITEVTHRDSKLRILQNVVAKYIPGMLGLCDSLGAFPETKIHDAIKNKATLQADDITLKPTSNDRSYMCCY